MKKNPKKPVAKATKKPTDIPISKTVARLPIPAVHLPPPPDDIEPGSPEEAFHYSIVGGYVRASRHLRNADRIRLESGVPYKGKDARLAGSVIYDRDALLKASERAEAEEREAEKCLAAADRAKQELQHYLDRKANLKLADALLKHTAALTNAPAPTTGSSKPPAPTKPKKPHAPPAKYMTALHREMIRAWLRDCGSHFSSYATTRKLNAKTDGGWLAVFGARILSTGKFVDDIKKHPYSFRAWAIHQQERAQRLAGHKHFPEQSFAALVRDIEKPSDLEKLVDSTYREDHPKKRR